MRDDTPVFVNPSGQRDNLGDSVLRRAYLDGLRLRGQLHVYVGTDSAYISGLGIRACDVTYDSKFAWLRAAIAQGARGSVYAYNAGEYVLDRRFLVNALWQASLVTLMRARGGSAIALGIAVRTGASPSRKRALRQLLRPLREVSWRDADSCRAVGVGSVAPDWAFALGSAEVSLTALARRDVVAVTMRGDRPAPDDAWVAAVRSFAESLGARVVVVNQMRADAARCAELAAALGGENLPWEADASHVQQEVRIRAVYAGSVAVVSDRIHALILGATEGAVPVGLTTSDPEKVRRTFAAVTSVPVARLSGDEVSHTTAWMQAIMSSREEILQDVLRARARLDGVRDSIRA